MSVLIERAPSPDPILRARGLEMNLRTRQVRLFDRIVPLTPREFQLLHVLMLNVNQVCSMGLLRQTLEADALTGDGRVRVCISRLRRRLDDGHHRLIRTAHGIGYRLAGRTS